MSTAPNPNGAPYVAPTSEQTTPPAPASAPQSNIVVVDGANYIRDPSGSLIPAVVQPLTKPEESAPAPTDTVEVATEVRQQVEGFLKTANISTDQVEQEIRVLGKVSDATRKALVDKHGAATANLVLNQIDNISKSVQAQTASIHKMQLDMVQEAFKGQTDQPAETSWAELVTWSRENIDAGTRKELNAMMKSGGFQAKQAVQYMISQLQSKSGSEQKGDFLEGGQGTDASGAGLLSASEYASKLDEVVKKHGYDSPQARALQQQRLNSRKRGV